MFVLFSKGPATRGEPLNVSSCTCRWHTYASRSYDGEVSSAMNEVLNVSRNSSSAAPVSACLSDSLNPLCHTALSLEVALILCSCSQSTAKYLCR